MLSGESLIICTIYHGSCFLGWICTAQILREMSYIATDIGSRLSVIDDLDYLDRDLCDM